MKRILILFVVSLLTVSTFSQTSNLINFNALEKKFEKSNADISNEKKNEKYKTWTTRGDLLLEIYDAMILKATTGLGLQEFSLIIGSPKQQNEIEIEGQPIIEVVMEKVNFYFIDGLLSYWTFTDKLVENPLEEALTTYLKALELDTRGRAKSSIAESLNRLKYNFVSEGSNCYAKRDYKCSYYNFTKAFELGLHPLVNHVDTAVIYYAGLSAHIDEQYENAIESYKKSIEYNFTLDGNVFFNLYEVYTHLENDEEALSYLKMGLTENPSNQTIIYGFINYYLSRGDDPSAVIEYLSIAKEAEPGNYSLYFAEGTVYDKLNKPEEAVKAYERSIELNPEYFDAVFNIGALYFNEGVKLLEDANKVPAREMDKYDALISKSNEEFRRSIPYMEKALELDPVNKPTIETLRNLYFRYRNDGPEMQEKLEKINVIWSDLQ